MLLFCGKEALYPRFLSAVAKRIIMMSFLWLLNMVLFALIVKRLTTRQEWWSAMRNHGKRYIAEQNHH